MAHDSHFSLFIVRTWSCLHCLTWFSKDHLQTLYLPIMASDLVGFGKQSAYSIKQDHFGSKAHLISWNNKSNPSNLLVLNSAFLRSLPRYRQLVSLKESSGQTKLFHGGRSNWATVGCVVIINSLDVIFHFLQPKYFLFLSPRPFFVLKQFFDSKKLVIYLIYFSNMFETSINIS